MVERELRSALIVAVPEAAFAVGEWLESTAQAKPSAGVPAHITIIFPFVPAAAIDDALRADLRKVIGAFESFSFELPTTGRFPGMLYLAPEPAEPFVRLTEAVLTAYPRFTPYEGAFGSIVPHLTVAEGDVEVLTQANADIRRRLPIVASADGVTLLEEVAPSMTRWQTRATFPLRTA